MKRLLVFILGFFLAGIILLGGCNMTAPTVQTVEAEEITNTEAILRAYTWWADPDNASYVIFRWRVVGDPDWIYSIWWQVTHETVNAYTAYKVTGFSPDTDYEFEFMGKEGANESFGGVRTFKTRATTPDGTAGHYWVEGDYWCYLTSAGYKKRIMGEG